MNIQELLLGNPVRLRYVHRFSGCVRVHAESVAEHSWFVTFMVYCMGHALNREGSPDTVDVGRAVQKALVHDVDESVTGDFPRPFKYSSTDLRLKLEEAAGRATREFWEALFPEAGSKEIWEHCTRWRNAKNSTREGRLVALADYLAVLSYLALEIKSNPTMAEHHQTMLEYGEHFKGPEFDFVRQWVDEALQFCATVLA